MAFASCEKEGRLCGPHNKRFDLSAEAVILRDLEEWSYEEIAASLKLPVGTVKSRIARGRGQLKAILAPALAAGKVSA